MPRKPLIQIERENNKKGLVRSGQKVMGTGIKIFRHICGVEEWNIYIYKPQSIKIKSVDPSHNHKTYYASQRGKLGC